MNIDVDVKNHEIKITAGGTLAEMLDAAQKIIPNAEPNAWSITLKDLRSNVEDEWFLLADSVRTLMENKEKKMIALKRQLKLPMGERTTDEGQTIDE